MADTNCVVLVGRLTRDMECKFTSGGMAIGKFSIAIGKRMKDGDGYKDYTSFFDCTCFGKTAENLAQYMVKGKQVSITGELHQDRWEKDGKQNSKVAINCNTIQLIGSKDSGTKKSEQPDNPPDFLDEPTY